MKSNSRTRSCWRSKVYINTRARARVQKMSSFDELLEEQRRRVHELEFSRGAGMSLPAPAVREILRNSGELEAIRRLALEDRKVWKKTRNPAQWRWYHADRFGYPLTVECRSVYAYAQHLIDTYRNDDDDDDNEPAADVTEAEHERRRDIATSVLDDYMNRALEICNDFRASVVAGRRVAIDFWQALEWSETVGGIQGMDNRGGLIPRAIGHFTRVRDVILAGAKIPDTLETLVCTRSLSAARCTKAERVFSVQGVRFLSVNHCGLLEVPTPLSPTLVTLSLDDNNLTRLPDAVCQLTTLEALRVSNNPLAKLPDCVSNMTALSVLHVNRTLITALPARPPPNLTTLHANGCSLLEGVPEEWDAPPRLLVIELADNPLLQRVPAAWFYSKMERFVLRNTPRVVIPPDATARIVAENRGTPKRLFFDDEVDE